MLFVLTSLFYLCLFLPSGWSEGVRRQLTPFLCEIHTSDYSGNNIAELQQWQDIQVVSSIFKCHNIHSTILYFHDNNISALLLYTKKYSIATMLIQVKINVHIYFNRFLSTNDCVGTSKILIKSYLFKETSIPHCFVHKQVFDLQFIVTKILCLKPLHSKPGAFIVLVDIWFQIISRKSYFDTLKFKDEIVSVLCTKQSSNSQQTKTCSKSEK